MGREVFEQHSGKMVIKPRPESQPRHAGMRQVVEEELSPCLKIKRNDG
jgi:hypothetical protein